MAQNVVARLTAGYPGTGRPTDRIRRGGTVARNEGIDIHREMVGFLLDKVAGDRYPSATMMNLVEQLITPEEVPAYAAVLMAKIRDDNAPSLDLIKRLTALG